MTEGEKAININFSLSLLPSRLRRATYCPLAVSRFCLCGLERRTKSTAAPTDASFIRHRRRSHMLPVRGRLYFNIIVNLIAPEIGFVFVSFLGGSKPPPYHVVVYTVSFATVFGCLSLTMQLLLFRKNHARLTCSVVNALTTSHCRYRLLRIADRGEPCPYGMIYNTICAKHPLLFIFQFSLLSFLCRKARPILRSHKKSRPEQLCSGRGLLLLYFTLFSPFRYRGQEPFGEPLQASLT